jgi:hypothetical protein
MRSDQKKVEQQAAMELPPCLDPSTLLPDRYVCGLYDGCRFCIGAMSLEEFQMVLVKARRIYGKQLSGEENRR